MCCRFTLYHSTNEIADWFEVEELAFEFPPRYNVAPGQPIPVILIHQGSRVLDGMRWGLVPSWAKSPAIGNKLLNARMESLTEKPSFKHAIKRRRCLIPADGFYEWQKHGKTSQPMYIRRPDGQPLAFAGLWEEWLSPDGSPLRTCTVITGPPNELMQPIHDRMPMIVRPEHHTAWLNPAQQNAEAALKLLEPYPSESLKAHPVSTGVNNVKLDNAILIEPVAALVTPETLSL